MKNLVKMLLLITLPVIAACQGHNNQISDIDKAIAKYEQTDFSELKNMSIYFRSRGRHLNSSIYFINKSKVSCSPYAVEVDNLDKSIVEIKNHLVISSCGEDYLTPETIEAALKKYFALNLYLVIVDSEGNVFINSFQANRPANLLRLAKESGEREIKKDYVYKHYKGRWYLKE